MNVSVNSNHEPSLGTKSERKNITQEWLPENFLQPVPEEEVAIKVPAPFNCAPWQLSKGEVVGMVDLPQGVLQWGIS